MPPGSPFGFDRSFDEKTGYRTQSLLVTPLMSSKGEVIGVLQLINKKREPKTKPLGADDFERHVIPSDERSEQHRDDARLAGWHRARERHPLRGDSLDLRGLREGVGGRDRSAPSDHERSLRAASPISPSAWRGRWTRAGSGPYREVRWTREDLREIEYASLLHDFGKIGVRARAGERRRSFTRTTSR